MKRKLLTSVLLALVGLITHAQDLDIKPSQQAQGILESKNGMVDHATGLFHYKVPLYEVKSGNFKMPITLNYVAKGVKVDDHPGLVGYNWMLNTGGVVTRTIRGGIADESYGNGYIHQNFDNQPTAMQIDNVNKRLIDGESDIFTVVLNGESVNFTIQLDGGKIVAVPLEHTNVKIGINGYNSTILGWTITDTYGTRYTYNEQEVSENIVKNNAISLNGIINKTYTSSWYISKIEPVNSSPIIFKYNTPSYYDIYSSYYDSKYEYGKFLTQSVFDFGVIKSIFFDKINEIIRLLSDENQKVQIQEAMYILIGSTQVQNPDYDLMLQYVNSNNKIMGILSSVDTYGNNVNAISELLDQLEDIYMNNVSIFNKIVEANHILYNSLNFNKIIMTETIQNSTSFRVKAPQLLTISYNENEIYFDYYGKQLIGIRELDISKSTIANIGFELNPSKLLAKINYKDKNNNTIKNIKFDYYPRLDQSDSDIWGYYKKTDNRQYAPYSALCNIEYAKAYSLKSIVLDNKTKISLDYEFNTLLPERFYLYLQGNQILDYKSGDEYIYGGIRIKNIVFDSEQKTDVINYKYPLLGESVHYKIYNNEDLRYPNFTDYVYHARVKFLTNNIIKYGNNGVYYSFVEEEVVGKGSKMYLFFVDRNPDLDYTWSYQINGLPLGVAYFDKDKKLIKLSKNKYSYNFYSENIEDEWFTQTNAIPNNKILTQIRAFEYYMNEDILRNHYYNQEGITILGKNISPINIYENNVKPRLNCPQYLSPFYSITYGGKPLIHETVEYNFPESIVIAPEEAIFYMEFQNTNVNRTKYLYDNSIAITSPTRVEITQSNGNRLTLVNKHVTEINNNVSTVINKMRERNMISPIIKQQTLLQKSGTNQMQLLSEKIFNYTEKPFNGQSYYLLSDVYDYQTVNPVNYNYSTMENSFYSFAPSLYRRSLHNNYATTSTNNNPIEKEEDYKKTFIKYENTNDNIMFVNDKYNEDAYIFVDNVKTMHLRKEVGFDEAGYQVLLQFLQAYDATNFTSCSNTFKTYKNSDEHNKIIEIILRNLTKPQSLSYNAYKQQIDNLPNDAFDKFVYNYELEVASTGNISHLNLPYATFEFIMNTLTENYYNKLSLLSDGVLAKYPQDKIFNITQATSKYKLFVILASNYQTDVYVHLNTPMGLDAKKIPIQHSQMGKLVSFDVDLSNYSAISSISVYNESLTNSHSGVSVLALVPSNCEFEATSYNTDGTVFCKFNQNGQMERYEYDAAGRPIKVFDQNANLLKEFKYNVVLN